ncbi:hypothetical protein TL16_g02305 [Triparma laevis f. inornata]|uniref:C2H2-type domain-containing protein n=1 Tax=Triparma laevis f. inornata TaxID=1714386 RepID=A0A9W6ZUS0_9STRA|nr:hypothetical protein TL16_g02305 [Triparma laevis f. inornata]
MDGIITPQIITPMIAEPQEQQLNIRDLAKVFLSLSGSSQEAEETSVSSDDTEEVVEVTTERAADAALQVALKEKVELGPGRPKSAKKQPKMVAPVAPVETTADRKMASADSTASSEQASKKRSVPAQVSDDVMTSNEQTSTKYCAENDISEEAKKKRGPGRPKGSKNKKRRTDNVDSEAAKIRTRRQPSPLLYSELGGNPSHTKNVPAPKTNGPGQPKGSPNKEKKVNAEELAGAAQHAAPKAKGKTQELPKGSTPHDNSSVGWHSCDQDSCKYRTKRAYDLNTHKMFKHNIDVKWFPCDQDGCNYTAKSAGNLKRHKQLIHNIERSKNMKVQGKASKRPRKTQKKCTPN